MVEITWLGHGTYQFQLPTGEVILVDPWIDGNPAYPKGIIIAWTRSCFARPFRSHSRRLPLAEHFSPEVVAIFETCNWLESKGAKNTLAMNKGGTQKSVRCRVTMTHAVHSCGILDDGKIVYGGEAAGYVMRLPDGRALYFAGDTNVFSDMHLIEQLYRPELAFLPIGDLYTMSPREAALACRLLKPRKVIPMHFGTFPPLTGRPEQLAELIRDLPGPKSGRSSPACPSSGKRLSG